MPHMSAAISSAVVPLVVSRHFGVPNRSSIQRLQSLVKGPSPLSLPLTTAWATWSSSVP